MFTKFSITANIQLKGILFVCKLSEKFVESLTNVITN